MNLKLKRVLITGSARGIGKVMARQFAERGAEVVLTDVQEELLGETRAELVEAGHLCRAYTADVTDYASVVALRERIHAEAGSIDVLVNNAGVVFGGPLLEVPIEKHHLTYRVNVEGPLNMTHAFLEDIHQSPRGHLVFIASASGFVGLPNGTSYASSKWAVIGFAESVRAELASQGHDHVGVTTVCPTYIATGMFDGAAPPKTTRMLEPEFIADKVVTAVEKNQVWVREPWIVKLTPFLKHCLPTPVSDFLAEALGANASMTSWKGHGPS